MFSFLRLPCSRAEKLSILSILSILSLPLFEDIHLADDGVEEEDSTDFNELRG